MADLVRIVNEDTFYYYGTSPAAVAGRGLKVGYVVEIDADEPRVRHQILVVTGSESAREGGVVECA